MTGLFRRVMFVFDAAACGAVWALLLVGIALRPTTPTSGFSALSPGIFGFTAGFVVGGVCGAFALRGLDEARQTRALYAIVGAFLAGMVLLRIATRAGYGAF